MSTDRSSGLSQTEPSVVGEISRTHFAAGHVLAGRYRVERLIGEGGMGDVYLAIHEAIDKPVAIKILAPEQMRRKRTIARFLQEAKAASKIRHENVVDITDFGESDGCAFLVMEYLEGEDLSDLAKREGRIPWPRAKHIVVQLLEGLAAAHKAGIIHRDVKPHNCFVAPRKDNPDHIKVIDFGIAKVKYDGSEEQLTRTGAIVGTAEYMSPEQGMGQDLDGRSDLYSVGVILYRLLTGRVPFSAGNPMAILYQHIHGDLETPSSVVDEPDFGPKVDQIVMRAMAKDRDHRFATADDFIDALKAIEGAGEAEPETPSRFPTYAAAGAAVLAAGLLGWWLIPSTAAPPPGPETSKAAVHAPTQPDPPAPKTDPPPPPADPPPEEADPPPEEADPPPEQDAAPPPEVAEQSPPSATEEASVPTRRSQRVIKNVMKRKTAGVMRCAKQAGLFDGEAVDVSIKIAPSGRVTSVSVTGAHSKAGAACIKKVIGAVRFDPATSSQSASHRFKI